MIPTLRRLRSDDNIVRQLQDATDNVFKAITSRDILDGLLIEDIPMVSGTPEVVSHGLGRKLKGWIVVRQNANTNIWDSQSTNTAPSSTLILNAGATVTISLWVF